MAATGDDSTPTGLASREPAPPGRPDPAAWPARRVSRTWWVLPYCAGALAVFVVAGLIIGLRYNSGTAQPAGLPSAAPMPAEMFPDALFGELTADLQAGNETAFLGLASASARPAIKTWWDNLRAIGFTTGAVIPAVSLDAVRIDSRGNGTTVILAGAHSPLDPDDVYGKPQIPMAHYRIGLHFSGPSAIGQITSWQPLDDAPWDLGSPLYVRKAANVVVAGPPADRALVDQTLPAAQTAAAYDIKMMQHVEPALLAQQGFVVFVSGSAAVRSRWFATDPQPSGWPPQFLGAQTVQLPGPSTSADSAVAIGQSSIVNNIADDSMGAARVVLAPAQPATPGALHGETVTLVGNFMLDILANQEQGLAGYPAKTAPSWTAEGFAVAVRALFETNPDPVPGTYSFATLTAELRALPHSYRDGTYPSTSDLFGPSAAAAADWGAVAASTYEYIDSRYGLSRVIVAAMLLYDVHPTPFGNIFKANPSPRVYVFFGIHSIRLGWAPWLARL
jgi:hypothetical protein